MLGIDRPEVPLARAEDHGHDVHRHLVHQAEGECLPADVARRHDDGAHLREFPGLRDRLCHITDEVVRALVTWVWMTRLKPRRLGSPPAGLGPVRHHDHVLARRRRPLPAVGQVEQVTPDHHRSDARPHRPDILGRGLRDLHRATVNELGVAVGEPVEQRADMILRVGDEAVHRHDTVHYYGAHPVSQVFRFQHVQQYIQTYRAGKLTGPRTGNPAGDLALPRGTPGPPGYLRRPGETVFLP